MALTSADTLHTSIAAVIQATATFTHPITGAYVDNVPVSGGEIEYSDEHIVSTATIAVPSSYVVNGSVSIFSNVNVYARHQNELTSSFLRKFQGIVVNITLDGVVAMLTCYDPLYVFNDKYYNFGAFEAQVYKVAGQTSIPRVTHKDSPLLPRGVDKCIRLIPINLGGGEVRYVVPGNYDTSDPPAEVPEYQEAYTGGAMVREAAYDWDDGTNYAYVGNNRRSWKTIGRVYDTGMDLDYAPNSFGQKICYDSDVAAHTPPDDPDDYTFGQPIPSRFYQIGTDLGNYLEFKDGYTPVGEVYVEYVDVYLEGTNDIEHIFQKTVNYRLAGVCASTNIESPAAGKVVANQSRFVSSGVIVGAKIKKKGASDSAYETVTAIDKQEVLYTDEAQSIVWAVGDEFEIFDGIEATPMWQDGVQYRTTGTYEQRTIWPSLTTINRIEWNAENGSVLKLWQTLQEKYAAPNYRLSWDHQLGMARWQYRETTPFDENTSYFVAGSYPYGAYKATYTGGSSANEYTSVLATEAVTQGDDEDNNATAVIVEGVNEHSKNILYGDDVRIITQPPGVAPSGWSNDGILTDTWTCGIRVPREDRAGATGDERTYAELLASDYADIKDVNVDTALGWWLEQHPPQHEEYLFVTFLTIDLGSMQEVGAIQVTAPWSKRDFPWSIRIECCDEDGLITGSGSQLISNDGAAWQLMHPEWYSKSLSPWSHNIIKTGWLKNYCRFIKISMTFAKIHDKYTHFLGLAEFAVYLRDVVTGQAKIVDVGGKRTQLSTLTSAVNYDATSWIVEDTEADFVTAGVVTGDWFYDVTTKQRFEVNSVAATALRLINPTDIPIAPGDKYFIVDGSVLPGEWNYFPGTDLNDAIYLANMPVYYQLYTGQYSDELHTNGKVAFPYGHKTVYYSDTSLSTTDQCAYRAAQILSELVRKTARRKVTANWHNDLELFRTGYVNDKRTGTTMRGMLRYVKYTIGGGVDLTLLDTDNVSSTGEIPEPLDA